MLRQEELKKLETTLPQLRNWQLEALLTMPNSYVPKEEKTIIREILTERYEQKD